MLVTGTAKPTLAHFGWKSRSNAKVTGIKVMRQEVMLRKMNVLGHLVFLTLHTKHFSSQSFA